MELTKEQQEIINTLDSDLDTIIVNALSGVGKTSIIIETIKEIIKREPDAKIFYTVFNKFMADEAENKFLKNNLAKNVECRTAHGFALSRFGKIKNVKPIPFLDFDYFEENRIDKKSSFLGVSKLLEEYTLSLKNMEDFCEEADNKIYNSIKKIIYSEKDIVEFKNIYNNLIKDGKYTHGMYLKEYVLGLSEITEFDYVFFDEAQDLDFFMLEMLKKFNCKKKYLLGDDFQNIYSFRSTINALKELKKDNNVFTLTQTFRFHNEIADIANLLLNKLSNGKSLIKTQVDKAEINHDDKTILCRTNYGMLEYACDNFHLLNKTRVEFNGIVKGKGTKEFTVIYEDFLSLIKIMAQESKDDNILSDLDTHFFIKNISKKILKMKKIASKENMSLAYYLDQQLENKIVLDNEIMRYYIFIKRNYENIINKLMKLQYFQDLKDYDNKYTFITAHRAKGAEFDNVIIAEDNWLMSEESDEYEEELRLIYVAITRAKQNLTIESCKIKELLKNI